MRGLVEWLREESTIHPVLVAGIAQFQLVHIHPFIDGNGRTSRLLSTLCLYRAGTISSVCSRSANITTVIDRRSTRRCSAYATRTWI